MWRMATNVESCDYRDLHSCTSISSNNVNSFAKCNYGYR